MGGSLVAALRVLDISQNRCTTDSLLTNRCHNDFPLGVGVGATRRAGRHKSVALLTFSLGPYHLDLISCP
jgi:hypothetical protein